MLARKAGKRRAISDLGHFLIYLKCNEKSLRFYARNKRQLCPKSLKGTLSGLWFCSLDQELWKWVSVRKKTIILALDTLTRV